MILPRKSLLLVPLLLGLALAAAVPFRAAAAGFPEITAEERALTSVPNEPNAPAVVLFKKGEFSMAGSSSPGSSRRTCPPSTRRWSARCPRGSSPAVGGAIR